MVCEWLACVLLAGSFLVAADPIPIKNHDSQLHNLGEAETLGLFQNFYSEFKKSYGSPEEFMKRFKIFQQSLEVIDRLNREERGTAKYGITRFADLTHDEFVANFTGGRLSAEAWNRHSEQMEDDSEEEEIEFVDEELLQQLAESESLSGELESDEDEDEEFFLGNGKVYIPKNFDYRKKKAVTPVKDQGNCGSCWAFSAIANIEGVWAKKKKELIDLSEQELLDCDKVDQGCNGGWMADAVKELVRLGGVAKSSDYKYTGKEGTCRFKKSMAAVKVSGTKSIPKNEKKMARALIRNGPLSIAIDASANFQYYMSGIFDPSPSQCSTNKNNVNHGVTIVAYGEEGDGKKKTPFWVIKNSWGHIWGDQGYIKIIRGKNACALTSYVSTAFL